jgi:hypothetical protein
MLLVLALAGCGGSDKASQPSTSSTATGASPGASPGSPAATAPTTTALPPGAVDPNAPEVVEPGDIPDDQVFVTVPSADGKFAVDVPEGWARTDANGVVTFTDQYNAVAIRSAPAATPPTVETVKATGLADVSGDTTFNLIEVAPVTRKAGTGVRAVYQIGSDPNPVTGKKALLEVERYFFSAKGTTVVLTLSGAKGADNVDPWKTVTDSLAFT